MATAPGARLSGLALLTLVQLIENWQEDKGNHRARGSRPFLYAHFVGHCGHLASTRTDCW
jgi:hypothetical protein